MRDDRLVVGDCLDVLRTLPAESVDACVCDPPYDLTARKNGGTGEASLNLSSPAGRSRITTGFMGKAWDGTGVAFDPATWRAVHRVLKPGAHLIAFGGTRTVHRLACAIEDAGFEIRDTIGWLQWQGFPKSLDVSKAIDAAAGDTDKRPVVGEWVAPGRGTRSPEQRFGLTAESGVFTSAASAASATWSGWGTALKPAHEPAVLARKPLEGTVAANVLKWGTGALNLDACRYAYGDPAWPGRDEGDSATNPAVRLARGCRTYCGGDVNPTSFSVRDEPQSMNIHPSGRFPANVYACPKASRSEREAGCEGLPARTGAEAVDREEGSEGLDSPRTGAGRTASAVRNHHPTVKPLALMRWLVRLVTPPAGLCLDPFLGSGTTGCAAILEGFRFLGIEREPDYARIAEARMAWADREREIATAQGDLFAVTPPLPGVPLPDRWRDRGTQAELLTEEKRDE